ncbi:hypothetical protein DCO58_08575 [Helicobacter saguini]|uniref:Uncharacterized protein n=1 Tax=Helicobacter saguini TaxID=1548018 RepID=A0A4U8SYA6_9HELI|nr:hypothetical protein [Helicobacter saguini]MWV67706.1 hypothetical protein [Helicobacter saguini]TLD92009.1 hypothetical protein LS64_010885 [Helicobacter saguini]
MQDSTFCFHNMVLSIYRLTAMFISPCIHTKFAATLKMVYRKKNTYACVSLFVAFEKIAKGGLTPKKRAI